MRLPTKRLHDALANVYFAFLGSLASIIGLLWLLEDKFHFTTKTGILPDIAASASGIILAGIAIYSIRVRQENREFRNFTRTLHRINHLYRDTLNAVFRNFAGKSDSPLQLEYLQSLELKTLRTVCQKLAAIYTGFTHTRCLVTIKLITIHDGRASCETYVRSEEGSERDNQTPVKFEINTGANTAFDRALLENPGGISHFYSGDLNVDRKHGYRNQRDHWSDCYLSAIVVPIRSEDPERKGAEDGHDNVGFLCIDTLSTNRLKDSWHVDMLAAFADQMYNFISMMRGKYRINNQLTKTKE